MPTPPPIAILDPALTAAERASAAYDAAVRHALARGLPLDDDALAAVDAALAAASGRLAAQVGAWVAMRLTADKEAA